MGPAALRAGQGRRPAGGTMFPKEKREGGLIVSEDLIHVEEEETPPPSSLAGDLFAWLQALVFALVCLVLAFTFFGRMIGVDGTSMLPTLEHGDMLLLQSVGYEPKQGDIVVLTKAFANIDKPIVKRIIAVGGQTVDVNYEEGTVAVDGQPLDEPYINEMMLPPSDPNMINDHVEVPEGSVYVMGDNRNHSSDSRDIRLGVVDNRYILGRAFFTVFPFRNIGPIN